MRFRTVLLLSAVYSSLALAGDSPQGESLWRLARSNSPKSTPALTEFGHELRQHPEKFDEYFPKMLQWMEMKSYPRKDSRYRKDYVELMNEFARHLKDFKNQTLYLEAAVLHSDLLSGIAETDHAWNPSIQKWLRSFTSRKVTTQTIDVFERILDRKNFTQTDDVFAFYEILIRNPNLTSLDRKKILSLLWEHSPQASQYEKLFSIREEVPLLQIEVAAELIEVIRDKREESRRGGIPASQEDETVFRRILIDWLSQQYRQDPLGSSGKKALQALVRAGAELNSDQVRQLLSESPKLALEALGKGPLAQIGEFRPHLRKLARKYGTEISESAIRILIRSGHFEKDDLEIFIEAAFEIKQSPEFDPLKSWGTRTRKLGIFSAVPYAGVLVLRKLISESVIDELFQEKSRAGDQRYAAYRLLLRYYSLAFDEEQIVSGLEDWIRTQSENQFSEISGNLLGQVLRVLLRVRPNPDFHQFVFSKCSLLNAEVQEMFLRFLLKSKAVPPGIWREVLRQSLIHSSSRLREDALNAMEEAREKVLDSSVPLFDQSISEKLFQPRKMDSCSIVCGISRDMLREWSHSSQALKKGYSPEGSDLAVRMMSLYYLEKTKSICSLDVDHTLNQSYREAKELNFQVSQYDITSVYSLFFELQFLRERLAHPQSGDRSEMNSKETLAKVELGVERFFISSRETTTRLSSLIPRDSLTNHFTVSYSLLLGSGIPPSRLLEFEWEAGYLNRLPKELGHVLYSKRVADSKNSGRSIRDLVDREDPHSPLIVPYSWVSQLPRAPELRGSAARAIPYHLGLFFRDPGLRNVHRRHLIASLESYRRALPYLVSHIRRDYTHWRNAEGIAPYYFYPSVILVTGAVEMLLKSGVQSQEEFEILSDVQSDVQTALASLLDEKGRFSALGGDENFYPGSERWAQVFGGLALLPLIRECNGNKVSSLGFLDSIPLSH